MQGLRPAPRMGANVVRIENVNEDSDEELEGGRCFQVAKLIAYSSAK